MCTPPPQGVIDPSGVHVPERQELSFSAWILWVARNAVLDNMRAPRQRRVHTSPMEHLETRLDGPVLIKPTAYRDERGFFQETYRRNAFAELGIAAEFVQDNQSRSARGVVRGMHFQVGDGAAKLVRCGRGAVLDVVVDIRRGSPTYGEWEAFELTDENFHQVYCPVGFAHGFCVLTDQADVMYKQTAYYDGALERGFAYDDPDVAIGWPDGMALRASERDANAPRLTDIETELPFVYRA
jgi:dTDP-4-dehydrorhamnose 3,5-epimerase